MPARSPTHRQEQAQARREQILRTALDLFAQQGFAATPTKQIARAIGITEGLLYHYFSSKNALFDEIIQQVYALGSNLVLFLVGQEEHSVTEIIPQLGKGFLQVAQQNKALVGLIVSESQFNSDVYQIFLKMLREITSPIISYLGRRVIAGEIRADVDLHITVDAFIGTMLFFYLTHRALSESEWQEESDHFIDQWFTVWYLGVSAMRPIERE